MIVPRSSKLNKRIMSSDVTAIGHDIGSFCVKRLTELPEDTSFKDRHEVLRVRFAVGIAIVMFAKQMTAAAIKNPEVVH